jgi:xanthine dehydrogenase molybdenum-binding subunit
MGSEHSGEDASDGLIWIDLQGVVHVPVGTGNLGTAAHTGIAVVVAQALDMPVEQLDVTWADTANVAWTSATHASRSCHCDGKALFNAAQDVIAQLRKLAARELKVDESRLLVRGGNVGTPRGAAVGFRTLARQASTRTDFTPYYDPNTDVNPVFDESTGRMIMNPAMKLDAATEQLARRLVAKGGVVGLGRYIYAPGVKSWGATFAEVEVDLETGQVHVLQLVSVHDVGRVLYRTGAEAQVHGGVAMGLGFAMREALVVDPNTHIPLNPSYLGLGVPTALDCPGIVPILLEAPVAAGPYGATGLGENTNYGVPPAIGNAIYNATGVRIDEIPYNWQRVYQALRESRRLSH